MTTRIRADFENREVVHPGDLSWQPSPMEGVERQMLDRVGDEVARATSIVRYAPGSSFSAHEHGGGEEILVLSGIFSDETGDYGPGSYLRNPIGSRHTPSSAPGCEIFVKLHQFDVDDDKQVALQTKNAAFAPGLVPGLSVLSLHSHKGESVALVRWAPGTHFQPHRHFGGEEIFVVEGVFEDEHGTYPAGTWIRSPHLSTHNPFSTQGCLIYVKTGHL